MGHIFTAKYIKDERELGKEAEKSSGNDLTCLKPPFLLESKKACSTYQKKVERDFATSEMVGLRRVLMVHSGQMPCDIRYLEGEVEPILIGIVFGGQEAATQWDNSAVYVKDLYSLTQWKMKLVQWKLVAHPSIRSLVWEQLGTIFWPWHVENPPFSTQNLMLLLFPFLSQDQMRRINPGKEKFPSPFTCFLINLPPGSGEISCSSAAEDTLCLTNYIVCWSQLLGGDALTQDSLVFPVYSYS